MSSSSGTSPPAVHLVWPISDAYPGVDPAEDIIPATFAEARDRSIAEGVVEPR